MWGRIAYAVLVAASVSSCYALQSGMIECPGERWHNRLYCDTLSECCGNVCCTPSQVCDVNGNCVNPQPPTPSPKPWGPGSLQWGAYFGPANPPVLATSTVLVVANNNELVALSSASGAVAWRVSVNSPSGFPVVVATGTQGDLAIIYSDNVVLALDASTGAHVWNFTLEHPPSQPLVVSDDFVFATGDTVFALLSATGEPRWALTDPAFDGSSFVVINGMVVYSYFSGVAAVPVGSQVAVWNNTNVWASPDFAMWAYKNRVIVNENTEGQGSMTALSTVDGSVAWKYPYQAMAANPGIFNGVVYFINTWSPYDFIDAINAQTGDKEWRWKDYDMGMDSNPSILGTAGSVVVFQDMTFAYGVQDGAVIWNVTAFFASPPISVAKLLLTGTSSGRIAAVDASTGAVTWQVSAPQDVCSTSPVVAGGSMYVTCSDGFVYAVQLQ